jgi:hypothetical protein
MEFACAAVCNGRPSHGMRLLTSHGLARDEELAWAFLRGVHFVVPADDRQRLSPTEQRTYDEMKSRPM